MASIIRGSGESSFSGSVSIGGTLTYEDVTSVDSVGVITARSGIDIGTGTSISSPANNELAFYTNGSEKVRITSAGNIGIGTDNPGFQLDVDYSSTTDGIRILNRANSSTSTSMLRFGNDENINAAFLMLNSSGYTSIGGTSNLVLGHGLSRDIVFATSGLERVRVSADGNIGIGTDNPTSKLEIYHAFNRMHQFSYDDNILSLKGANNSGNPENLRFIGDSLRFNTGITGSGTEKLRITSDGKVGIGVTSPQQALHLAGNALVEGVVGSNSDAEIQADINANSPTSGDIIFSHGLNGEHARIDSSGRLLVGTASPGGGIQNSLATIGACTIHSTGIIEIASGGTLDLPSVGTSMVGHLYVHSVYTLNAAIRTSKVFFVAGRFGDAFTATELNSNNGSSGGRSFTISNPSNNIIRFTDTSGTAVRVTMSFVGSLGF